MDKFDQKHTQELLAAILKFDEAVGKDLEMLNNELHKVKGRLLALTVTFFVHVVLTLVLFAGIIHK